MKMDASSRTGFWLAGVLLASPLLIWGALLVFTLFGGSQEVAGGMSWFAIVAIFTLVPCGALVLVITVLSALKKARADQ